MTPLSTAVVVATLLLVPVFHLHAADSKTKPQSTTSTTKKESSDSAIITLKDSISATEATTSEPIARKKKPKKLRGDFRGWEYLASKLHQEGISEKDIQKVYGSTRMPRFSPIPFSVSPKESARIYKSFLKPSRLKIAERYLKKYKTAFRKAESHFKVSRYVIGAIIYVETQCGTVTGSEIVVNRLSRVATIAEPKNVKANYLRLLEKGENVTFAEVEERGQYLEQMFFPEIPALFQIADKNKINIFGIRGSYAGAFGIPQFLPSTYIKFGVDANKDGRVSLYQDMDAIWSTANFLSSFGWKPGISLEEKKKVIWRYNRSDAYVDAILAVAEKLEKRMK